MRPLDGIRVVEIGQVIAAPYATTLLADMGAEVIKVERPPSGDSARDPSVTDMRGFSATFLAFNHNKRSVVLDLKAEADYGRLCELVRGSDVVVSNVIPATAARLRLDHDSLKRVNSRIVTCSISGFGYDSPNAELPSYDLIHQAMAGYMQLTGAPDDPPVRVGIPLADLAAGLFAAYGILAALRARDITGEGDSISIAMHDCMLSLLTYQAMMYLTAGIEPQRMGSAHEFVIPWQAFETADGHMVVASRSNFQWAPFCEAIALPDLAGDARFTTNDLRLLHRADLESILADQLRRATTEHWMTALRARNVPCSPVNSLREAFADPHVEVRAMVNQFEQPKLGTVKLPANPVHFRNAQLAEPTPAPALGADNDVVFGSR
jgi:crotonobetainyl-CoA:carnitine CoA-transferase CaiB-like acyl-CoA transferase